MDTESNATAIFGIGEVVASNLHGDNLFGESIYGPGETRETVRRVVKLYMGWKAESIAAIECFLIIARRLKVVKDIRNLIAKLLWTDRALWAQIKVKEGKQKQKRMKRRSK